MSQSVSVSALAALDLIPEGDELIITPQTVDLHNQRMKLLSAAVPGAPVYTQSADQIVSFVPANEMTKRDAAYLLGVPVSVAALDGKMPPQLAARRVNSSAPDIPDTFDVRTAFSMHVKNWKVQNQLRCGSCWAVSAADALSFVTTVAKARATGVKEPLDVEDLSAMQVLACNIDAGYNGILRNTELQTTEDLPSNSFKEWQRIQQDKAKAQGVALPDVQSAWGGAVGALMQSQPPRPGPNEACDGGYPSSAQLFLALNSGLAPSSTSLSGPYRYPEPQSVWPPSTEQGLPPELSELGQRERARFCVPGIAELAPLSKCEGDGSCVVLKDPVQLKRFMMVYGPVQTAIAVVDKRTFMAYKSGIYTSPPSRTVDGGHAVVIAGWGYEETNGARHTYWLLKNSWGADWGMDGYMKVAEHDIMFTMGGQTNIYGFALKVLGTNTDPTEAFKNSLGSTSPDSSATGNAGGHGVTALASGISCTPPKCLTRVASQPAGYVCFPVSNGR